jgi:hypothetical protein
MNRTFKLALGVTGLFAAPALAQSTGTVSVDGSVADRCLFTTASATISLGELSQSGDGAGAGKLDPSTVNGESATLNGWCNGSAATMTVEAQPLLNVDAASAPTGFDRRVDFTATATANEVDGTDTSTAAGAGTAVDVGLFTGAIPVVLSAASSPTNGLLVAGAYQGQVLVTLTPNVSFGQEQP